MRAVGTGQQGRGQMTYDERTYLKVAFERDLARLRRRLYSGKEEADYFSR